MLKIGGKDVDTLYVGSKLVKQVYKGSKKVYPDYGVIPKQIKDAMVLWYDIAKQGCTNENMASNPILKDLSGNGHDATCYNFAWSGMSGVGGYNISPSSSSQFISSGGKVSFSSNKTKCTITKTNSINKFWEIYIDANETSPEYKIKVQGLNDSNLSIIVTGINLSDEINTITQDGEYIIEPVTANDSGIYPGLRFDKEDELSCNITIELLPLYPNALVSDGVDDYAQVTGLPLLNKEDGFTVIAKRQHLDSDIKIIASKRTDKTWGAFTIEDITEKNTPAIRIFGDVVDIEQVELNKISYISYDSLQGTIYNGVNCGFSRALIPDSDNLNLLSELVSYAYSMCALHSLLLFNRTLTTDEIEWVKTNLIEGDTEL